MWNTSCDIEFLHNLARNFGAITKRGTHATAYAIAAISGFAYKVGGTAKLKACTLSLYHLSRNSYRE